MSQQLEIGRKERLRSPLRTAAPPPPPGLQRLPRGAAAAAASSTAALPPSAGPPALDPARAHARSGVGDPGAPGASGNPLGAPRRRRDCRSPRPALVSAGLPAHSPAPRGKPLAPRRGSQRGRRVSTARSARRLLPSPRKPPLRGYAAPPLLTPGCSNPGREQNMGRRAPHHPHSFQVSQLWEGATNGGRGAP